MQVESWFDIGGASPKGARVQVFHSEGEPLTQGRLDANGIFIFSVTKAEPLRVVVSAGDGHRAEQVIAAEAVARSLARFGAFDVEKLVPVLMELLQVDRFVRSGWPVASDRPQMIRYARWKEKITLEWL